MKKTYDLVVIGAGSGGLVSAEVAAKFGAKVAMIEALPNLGGECLNAGCVPSKALIKAARTAYAAKNGGRYGVSASPVVDFTKVMKHVKSSIATIEASRDNDEHYIELGVDMYHGKAQFTGMRSVTVAGEELIFKKCIIATGSRPLVPAVPGLNKTSYLTNESIFDLTQLPKRLTVIGGGPISVELGQAFAMLGSEVTLLVREDRLLPREEPAAAAALQAEFTKMGITMIFGVDLKETSGHTGKIRVSYTSAGKDLSIDSTHLLVAAGRIPNTDVNVDAAGIALTERGAIVVNENLQSRNKNIYAIGDCNGGMQFTHVAAAQATMAVQNALLWGSRKNGKEMPVWCTFTTPEIAHLGASEAELQKNNLPYVNHTFSYDEIDKAVAEGEDGYIQVLVSPSGSILGATIVGENAGELTSQIVLAVKNNLSFKRLGATLQAYPTYGLGLKEMASRVGFEDLLRSKIGKIIRRII
jgi:pyruvate/2-oxoglutarate dehydrogenase complex dihydrolipoamide dehydrogenase (E3) component